MSTSNLSHLVTQDTICALSTANGIGAIAVIRVSGSDTFNIVQSVFSKPLKNAGHTIQFGTILDGTNTIDDVVLSLFKGPSSYTGEDVIEISCHGSDYIQQKIMELLIAKGCRLAKPGEYTMRAFMNNKMDLSQAEAVADLIASHSHSSHDLAIKQMRGGFSKKIALLREQLVKFSSLIELELDFSQEDVEFANRKELQSLLDEITIEIDTLIESFNLGNAIKKGIPVAIIGKPNVGKSTLLNKLLKDDKAIVSDIPGTTRDSIEDTITLGGTTFRFIDTAGLRNETKDKIEYIGIEKAFKKIEEAKIILYVFDIVENTYEEICQEIAEFRKKVDDESKQFIVLANKADLLDNIPSQFKQIIHSETIFISAKNEVNLNLVSDQLTKLVNLQDKEEFNTIITNTRHVDALSKAREAIDNVFIGLQNEIPSDLLAIDIRTGLHHLGEITGEVTTDEILENIFGSFCIGK